MAVPQDQLITLANGMIDAVQTLRVGLQNATDLSNQYINLNAGAGLQGLPTCAVNADGSLGTVDPSPVSGNVIDTRAVTRLKVAISSYDLGVVHSLLQAYANLLDGAAVATQTYAPAMLAKTSQ